VSHISPPFFGRIYPFIDKLCCLEEQSKFSYYAFVNHVPEESSFQFVTGKYSSESSTPKTRKTSIVFIEFFFNISP